MIIIDVKNMLNGIKGPSWIQYKAIIIPNKMNMLHNNLKDFKF